MSLFIGFGCCPEVKLRAWARQAGSHSRSVALFSLRSLSIFRAFTRPFCRFSVFHSSCVVLSFEGRIPPGMLPAPVSGCLALSCSYAGREAKGAPEGTPPGRAQSWLFF